MIVKRGQYVRPLKAIINRTSRQPPESEPTIYNMIQQTSAFWASRTRWAADKPRIFPAVAGSRYMPSGARRKYSTP